jgi:hypothetical protein
MDHEGYYAEAFYPEPGQCLRMIMAGAQGSPALCPKPVEFRGRFQDGAGKWHDVWSCIDHAGDLTDWRRVNASVTDIQDAPNSAFRKGR